MVQYSLIYLFFSIVSDVDKTIFDWCKEGNLSQVKRISSTRDFDINLRDENVRHLSI